MKGISPIISIIILLLITVSLAASAWMYISGYWSGLTATGVEITSTICSGGTTAVIYVRNIGTTNINLTNGLDIERVDNAGRTPSYTYDPEIIGPGETGKIKDTNCTASGIQQRCSYDVVHVPSGRLYQAYTTCYG